MYKYSIKFLALTDTITFDVSSENFDFIDNFTKELLFIFAKVDEDNQKIIIESYQQNNADTIQKITDFTNKYNKGIPQLNCVSAFFNKLKHDEHFFFLPNIKLETIEKLKLYDYLRAISEDKNFDEIHGQTKELFEKILQKYEISVIGDKRITIGEPIKMKRVCRFCGNTTENVTFNNKSHAISEGLGNKTAVLFDECDTCNTRFSETIEPHIIQYLALFRTIFDVKGKGGSKQFKGENFELKKDENIHLSFHSIDDRPEFGMPYKLKLETKDPIILQNIYKCLCKFFLSVIPTDKLQYFSRTIDWINGNYEVDKLPKVAEMISYHAFAIQPKMVVYFRKDKDKRVPFAVGEFYFTCRIFSFIIPLSDQDEKDFLVKNDFDNYWQTFQHYKRSEGWEFRDYSNKEPKKITLVLNFKQRDKSEDEILDA
ncbi:MAG: hypothetical protein H6Q15_1915 [Bacteroidetes bacterium]|nr:hypothetical protein [Bacteroidota bacterium]